MFRIGHSQYHTLTTFVEILEIPFPFTCSMDALKLILLQYFSIAPPPPPPLSVDVKILGLIIMTTTTWKWLHWYKASSLSRTFLKGLFYQYNNLSQCLPKCNTWLHYCLKPISVKEGCRKFGKAFGRVPS